MFLFKRSNGIYYIIYTLPDGTRKAKSTGKKLKRQANLYLSHFKNHQENTKPQERPAPTLDKFFFEFLRRNEGRYTEKSFMALQSTVKHLIAHTENPPVTAISPQRLQEYIDHRRKKTAYQARKDVINLKAAFRWGFEQKILSSNPAAELKTVKIPEKAPTYFDREQAETLIHSIQDGVLRDLVTIALFTGARQMELIKLTPEQVNIEQKTIAFDNREHITKSKRTRLIPMTDNIIKILRDRKKGARANRIFHRNGKELKQTAVTREFKKYVRKLGFDDRLNFHSLRHTFASWLVQKEVPIYAVSKLLGHADIKTTEIYAHLQPDNLKSAVDLLI